MTTDPSGCLDDLSIPEVLYDPSSSEGNFPPNDLIDLNLGQSPPLESQCSQLEPNSLPPNDLIDLNLGQSPPLESQCS